MSTMDDLTRRNDELRAAVAARQAATAQPVAEVPPKFFDDNPGVSLRPARPATVPPNVPKLLRSSIPPDQLEVAWAATKERAGIVERQPVRIIGFAGAAGAGKSLAASMVPDGEVIQLADPLYAMLSMMLGVDEEQLRDQEFKRTPIDWIGRTPRELLQTLGTEWGRCLVREDIWLLIAGREIDRMLDNGAPVVCVADVRFDNEAQMIRERGGQVWRIVRGLDPLPAQHSSERGVSDHLVDRVICNAADIDALRAAVHKAVGECT